MFDPYHKWLGIAKDQRPPTHYQLLSIPPGETDPEVIEDAAVRPSAHVRTYQIGPHGDLCTRLLNEIAHAKQVLLNPAKRKVYDEQLAKNRIERPSDVNATAITASPHFRLEDDTGNPEVPRAAGMARPAPAGATRRWVAIAAGGGALVVAMIVAVALALGPGAGSRDPLADSKKDVKKDVKKDDKKRKRIVLDVEDEKGPIEIVKPVDPRPDKTGLVPGVPPQPPPPPGVAGKTTIDLIPLIDPTRDTVFGQWKIADNVLHCNDRGLVPRIQVPYQPPEEYDFTVTFSQPGLRNGISLVMPKPGGGSFFMAVGYRQGAGFRFSIKDFVAPDMSQPIEVKRCYTATAQIRKDRIRGILDGKVLVDHPTDFRDLSSDQWRNLRDPSVLAVACDDPTVFHHVRVTEITGAGKKVR